MVIKKVTYRYVETESEIDNEDECERDGEDTRVGENREMLEIGGRVDHRAFHEIRKPEHILKSCYLREYGDGSRGLTRLIFIQSIISWISVFHLKFIELSKSRVN